MGSSSSDLQVIISLIIIVVLWVAFNGLFYSGSIESAKFQPYQDQSFTSTLFSLSSNFLGFMFIKSDIAFINQMFIIPVGAIVLVLALRWMRN